MMFRVLLVAAVLLVAGVGSNGLSADGSAGLSTFLAHFSKAAFAAIPSLPDCTKLAGLRGDPAKEPSSLMVKMDSGCAATYHWHTANEELLLLQGRAKAQIGNQPPVELNAGAYAILPARVRHRFRCVSDDPCIFFDAADAIFDVHNVDRNGREISADDAIKASAQSADW